MEKLLFLDTETTGLGPEDRLCQVACAFEQKNDPVTPLIAQLFKPPIPISIDATVVSHITNKHVEDKEVFEFSKMRTTIKELLEDHILVAHNAVFDIKMLEREGLKVPNYICTMRVAKKILNDLPRHNLQYIRYALNIDIDATAHSAEGDVCILIEIFKHLRNKVSIDEMIAMSKV